ncbi:MAG: FkbM family methyltransferase [Rhodospirillaceae bacterium]|nr:FkbM family methyltransferase [Rhodospirillaceae bacterium]
MAQNELSFFRKGPRILNDHFTLDPNEFLYWNLSYSMQGEDLVLRSMLKGKLKAGEIGFYVDLGSYDCRYGSNSYLFYRYGWRGICVDVNPGIVSHYSKIRPRDVFVSAAVGEAGKGYFIKAAMEASSRVVRAQEEITSSDGEIIEVSFLPLDVLFNQHVPPGVEIDFMNIDIEGGELSALKSNNWSRYRPKIIMIEVNDLDMDNFWSAEVLRYLRDLGYKTVGVMFPNVVMIAT